MPELIPLPIGFRAAGVYCGIKTDAEKLDLALFVSDRPATAAGVFTQNRVCGAPVKVSRSRVPRGTARAVVINSGNANACTGERGLQDARWMTAEVARQIGCSEEDVLVCSTGVIGHFLSREKLAAGIPAAAAELGDTAHAFHRAACGMMTTDTFPKQAMSEDSIGGHRVRVCGACKGAAMIAPNMATMLSVIMTDAHLEPADAQQMLRDAVNASFNCISVEGHQSTSDTVLLLANGASGAALSNKNDRAQFAAMLGEVCGELAQAIVRDAEGAGHFITLDVQGLRTRKEAYAIAKAIAESPLVKTAIAGADPNWGRIVSAAGYAGVDLAEQNMSLWINGTLIYERGAPVSHDAKAVSQGLRDSREVHLELRLDLGDEGVRFWTSDLTAEYVRLNSDYTT